MYSFWVHCSHIPFYPSDPGSNGKCTILFLKHWKLNRKFLYTVHQVVVYPHLRTTLNPFFSETCIHIILSQQFFQTNTILLTRIIVVAKFKIKFIHIFIYIFIYIYLYININIYIYRNKKGDYNKFWPKDKKKIPPQHTYTQKMKKKAAWFY